MALIKSISGIRGTIGGTVGEALTPVDVVKYAAAFGTWVLETTQNNNLVIGRDARLSGEMVSKLVAATLQGLGINVIDLGPDIDGCTSTPIVLDTGITNPNSTFQWFLNGNPIAGESGPSIIVTASGLYRVEAFVGICYSEDEINVIFNPLPVPVVPDDIALCDELPNDGARLIIAATLAAPRDFL